MGIVNPRVKNQQSWYSYYAGFSTQFVNSVIDELKIASSDIVLDPWNGSGTTTTASFFRGIPSIGFDVNPATIAVAKSRLLHDADIIEIERISNHIILSAKKNKSMVLDSKDDMLLCFFDESTAKVIRKISLAISSFFNIESGIHLHEINGNEGRIASFFYVALYCTVKHYIAEYKSKNPTWTKDTKVAVGNKSQIYKMFIAYIKKNYSYVINESHIKDIDCQIRIGTSKSLPLEDCSVDYIITSPPYCTRIDYAVSTKAELAVLGYPLSSFSGLRDSMMGTSTIHCSECLIDDSWGQGITSILNKILHHKSYASASYYYKTYWQYFNDCCSSLLEINRVLKNGGKAVIVVQDSYYKDLHVDLAQIYTEELEKMGLNKQIHKDYIKSNSMVTLNSNATHSQNRKRIETVLIFEK